MKDEFEVIETKLAELYGLQRNRVKREMERELQTKHSFDSTTAAITEAREILDLWMCCIEARGRANRRFKAKGRLDEYE